METTGICQGNSAILHKLQKIPTLRDLGEKELRDLLRSSELRTYRTGECILKEGAPEGWVYYLISGKVKITKDGKVLMVLQRSGDIFGEISLWVTGEHTVSVTAITDILCLALDSAAIDPGCVGGRHVLRYILYREFAESLANRLKITSEELVRTRKKLDRLEAAYKMAVKTVGLFKPRLSGPRRPGDDGSLL